MKVIKKEELSSLINSNQTLMIGGFMSIGIPETIVDYLSEMPIQDLTIITNDTGVLKNPVDEKIGVGKLLLHKKVQKVIASHIGMNAETGRQMIAEEIEVELIPQGTLVERIHAGGAGLGGILTPTGVGTVVQEGKEVITVDGKDYLLEKALQADIALIKAHKADTYGNLVYHQAARNFNPVMALAAKTVIVEVDELVELGELDPEEVITPFIIVDKILVKED